MVRDANGRSHRAAGRPDGGEYEPERSGVAADDVTPPASSASGRRTGGWSPVDGWSRDGMAAEIGMRGLGAHVDRRVWDEYTMHPRRRSYMVEGSRLDRPAMRRLARSLAVDTASHMAGEQGLDGGEAGAAAAGWFDANWPEPGQGKRG